MTQMPITNALRGGLGEAVREAKYRGQRTTILVKGRPAAVLVSIEDAAKLPAAKSEAPLA